MLLATQTKHALAKPLNTLYSIQDAWKVFDSAEVLGGERLSREVHLRSQVGKADPCIEELIQAQALYDRECKVSAEGEGNLSPSCRTSFTL